VFLLGLSFSTLTARCFDLASTAPERCGRAKHCLWNLRPGKSQSKQTWFAGNSSVIGLAVSKMLSTLPSTTRAYFFMLIVLIDCRHPGFSVPARVGIPKSPALRRAFQ